MPIINKTTTIENKILNVLEMERFHQWYETDFVNYIGGIENAKSKEDILNDIKEMFK